MSYSSGMLDKRVTILTRDEGENGSFGYDSGGVEWREVATVWAAVDWTRGARAMRQGMADAYDIVMVRMRYRLDIDRHCRLRVDGTTYQIERLRRSRSENTIQITATEVIEKGVVNQHNQTNEEYEPEV